MTYNVFGGTLNLTQDISQPAGIKISLAGRELHLLLPPIASGVSLVGFTSHMTQCHTAGRTFQPDASPLFVNLQNYAWVTHF